MRDVRAVRITRQAPIEEQPLETGNVPRPSPSRGQLLVKVHMCGVCHTDLHTVEGDIHPPFLPVTPGHQVVGEVDAVGEGAAGWAIGDRVGIPWLYDADGSCDFCQQGQENLCPQARFTGFDVDGGYAEYMLASADYALRLPDTLDDSTAAPLLCAGVIGYRSLRQAELAPGESLGLVGFGASAHLAIQVARHWGCPVSVFTRSDSHRQLARELGAEWAGGADDDPPHPLDRIVTFAPAGSLVPKMLAKLRPGGTLAINAIHMSPIPEFDYQLIYGERTLRSVANLTRKDGQEFLALAAEIPIRPMVETYSLEDANQALADLKHSRIDGAAVLEL
jgi:propanol-preferring alcohol dehydrogenase